jgi:hypothetical protein
MLASLLVKPSFDISFHPDDPCSGESAGFWEAALGEQTVNGGFGEAQPRCNLSKVQ